MAEKARFAIAVSGKGRSLENFLKNERGYEIAAVISSNPEAGAVGITKEHGLPLYVFDWKAPDPQGLDAWLRALEVEWVALAGFLKVFPSLPSYDGRVTNIHPALLPRHGGRGMYGMRVHEAVCKAGDATTGATIHFVNDRYDEGAIIAQAELEIPKSSTPEEIAQRVFALECELYPQVLARLANGELPLNDGRIWHYRSERC